LIKLKEERDRVKKQYEELSGEIEERVDKVIEKLSMLEEREKELTDKYEKMEQTISSINTKLNFLLELKEDISKIQKNVEFLFAKQQNVEDSLRKASVDRKSLSNELVSLLKKLEKLEERIDRIDKKEMGGLLKEFEKVKVAFDKLRNDVKSDTKKYLERVSVTEATVDEITKNILEVKDSLSKMLTIKDFEEEKAGLVKSITEHEKRFGVIEKDIKTILSTKASVDRLNKLWDEFSLLEKNVREKLNDYRQKIQYWESLIRSFEKSMGEIKRSIEKLASTKDLLELKTYVNEFVAEYEKKFEMLRDKVENLPITRDVEEMKAYINELVAEYEKRFDLIREKIEKITTSSITLKKIFKEKIRGLDEIREEVKTLQRDIDSFKRKVSEIEDIRKLVSKVNETVIKDLERLEKSMDKDTQQNFLKISQLEKRIVKIEGAVSKLREDIEKTKEFFEEKQKTILRDIY
jgi:chromosome segregation ATPase